MLIQLIITTIHLRIDKGFSHLLQVGNQHSEDEPSHLSTLENQHGMCVII